MPSIRKAQAVFSVDLATRRYRDLGMAFLPANSEQVSLVLPDELGLSGEPQVAPLAAALDAFCTRERVSVLLLDGPQGWRHPASQIEHMRLCERVLNTPCKTGTVGLVKPRTYQNYVQFCIDLFATLRLEYGWKLLTQQWNRKRSARWIVESFPSAAWPMMGLPKLPAKSKTKKTQIETWAQNLSAITGLELPSKLTHDQLQSIVVLPAGRAIAENKPDEVILSGTDPFTTKEGDILEGWIANPRLAMPDPDKA